MEAPGPFAHEAWDLVTPLIVVVDLPRLLGSTPDVPRCREEQPGKPTFEIVWRTT